MVKSVFALVLLYFCCNTALTTNLTAEIASKLQTLHRQLSVKSLDGVHMPTKAVLANVNSCAAVLASELKHLLSNVTVHDKADKNILPELQANLQYLEQKLLQDPRQQTDMCQMEPAKAPAVFQRYVFFFRKLNNSKKK